MHPAPNFHENFTVSIFIFAPLWTWVRTDRDIYLGRDCGATCMYILIYIWVLNALHIFNHSVLTIILGGRCYYFPHFTNKETESLMICSRSLVTELGFKLVVTPSRWVKEEPPVIQYGLSYPSPHPHIALHRCPSETHHHCPALYLDWLIIP